MNEIRKETFFAIFDKRNWAALSMTAEESRDFRDLSSNQNSNQINGGYDSQEKLKESREENEEKPR
jgi:hypothetical protein